MSLPAGTRLGQVEILSPIGSGGMGEVYRARDTRLKRDIAVKVLPFGWSLDGTRLARFEREAEVLAKLNHPNIAAIFGMADTDAAPALLLELVEGPTLAERLEPGPLPVAEAIAVARQLTDALGEAHDRGVVHRDLKPANIKVREDGVVKVLDFGLAKMMESESAPEATVALDRGATHPGIILGTAAYMSPEQARGQPVDKRADIWAFGCVLYEMLAGRSAFARPTVTGTLAAVVEEHPDWTALPPTTPPAVARVLRRCLEKDLRRRVRDIADARLDLDDAADRAPAAAGPERHGRGPRGIVATSVIAAAVAIGAAVWITSRPATIPAAPVRFNIEMPEGEELPLDAGLSRPFAISRDGASIVFVSRRSSGNRILRRGIEDVDAVPIAGTEGGNGPFLSPDGEWLGFASEGFVRKVPVRGGIPQNIAPVQNMLGATWSDDDTIVFHGWQTGLYRIPAGGGSPEPLTQLDPQRREVAHQAPFSLPGARAVVFTAVAIGQPLSIELVHLASGKRTRLLEGGDPHYLSSGHLLFTRAGRLHTVPFELTRLSLAGPEAPVPDETRLMVNQGRSSVTAALNGALGYVLATPELSRLVTVNATGGLESIVDGEQEYSHPRYSPDGRRVVVEIGREGGGNGLWVYDLERRNRLSLSAGDRVSRPIWSHDGRTITFQREGSLYSIPADDSGPPTLLLARGADANALFPLAWSRDGRTLVYSRPAPGTNRDVLTFSPGSEPVSFLTTPRDERSASLSPDGRWMVYAALEAGREEEVYLQRYPGPGDRAVISVGGGREPVWSRSGGEVFYRSNDGQRMLAVTVKTEPTISLGRPRTLFQGAFQAGMFWSEYDVHPATGQFVMLALDKPLQPRVTVALHTIDTRPEPR